MSSPKHLANGKNLSDCKLAAFILGVVNAADDKVDGSTDYFFPKFEEFFPTKEQDIETLIPFLRRKWTTLEGVQKEVRRAYYRTAFETLRDGLRAIWNAEDDYTAKWGLFCLRLDLHSFMTDHSKRCYAASLPPPRDNPLQQACSWLWQHIHELRQCANPDCTTPYFLGTGKRRYCQAGNCAEVGQKQAKLKWWKEKGQETRKARRGLEEAR